MGHFVSAYSDRTHYEEGIYNTFSAHFFLAAREKENEKQKKEEEKKKKEV